MARMPANFLAAVQGIKDAPIVPVVTVYWPSAVGTKYYASEPFQFFEQRIPEGGIGNVQTSASERPSDLTFQTCEIRLADSDYAITEILQGEYEPRRSRVVAQWAHPGLDSADWFTFFDGIVDDWSFAGGEVSLNCKTDDVPLYGYCPKAPLITGSVPGLVNGARGLYPAIIYGIHDDQSLEGKGAISCPNVILDSTNGYWYIVGIGVMDDVPRVYKNGTLQTVSSHYNIRNPKWGGTTFTAIQFVSATVATDVVTADVQGLTDEGDGTGGLITGSAAQLKHFLVNFAYGDWRTGSWLEDSTAPVDTAAFAETATFLDRFGGEGSLYIGGTAEQERCLDVVNRWLKSNTMVRGRWSADGNLGVKPFNHAAGEYLSTPWVQHERDEIGASFRYEATAAQLVSRVSLSYLPGQRAGKLWQSMDLQDLRLWEDEKVTENIRLETSAARYQ